MKKITALILFSLVIISCNRINEKTSYNILGTLPPNSTIIEEVILVTQSNEIQDTTRIISNTFEFNGIVSEPTNAAIIVDGKMIQFPLVNDEIEIKISNINNKEFEINYNKSQVNNNLKSYYNKESKEYISKYKLLEEQKVNSTNDDIKYKIMISKDSLAINFIQQLVSKYESFSDKSGLPIIINDLKGLIGTRNHPTEIGNFFKLLPLNEQNGFYGSKIKTYLEQSSKIALGQPINFDFVDINKNTYELSEFKGKLILLEFWASWCGPCISQIPFLKEVSEKKEKIQIISISIDEDLNKWKNKVKDLNMSWINIHYKQKKVDLKKDFFISGVPYNILVSQDGKILRKNITMTQLLELLK